MTRLEVCSSSRGITGSDCAVHSVGKSLKLICYLRKYNQSFNCAQASKTDPGLQQDREP